MRLDLQDPATILLAAAIPLGGMVIALIVLRRGARGRRIDDHPLCRKCRYDLFGLPAPAACPECGVDLAKPAAVVIGNRQPRRFIAGTGWALLLLALVSLIVWGRTTYRVYSIDANKPTWWLIHRIGDRHAPTRNSAVDELQLRRLTPAQRDKVVDRALAIQANDQIPWHPGWGEFVESARQTNQLDDARWQRYLRQAIPLAVIDHRKVVRRGDPVPFLIRQGPSRTSTMYIIDYATRIELNGAPVSSATGLARFNTPIGPPWPTPSTPNPHRLERVVLRGRPATDLRDGPQKMSVEFDVTIHSERFGRPAAKLGEFTLRHPCDWTLVPADTPIVQLVEDPAMTADIQKRLRVASITRNRGALSISIAANGLSTPVAATVFVRSRGKDHPAGRVILGPLNDTATAFAFDIEGVGAGAAASSTDKVDIILRASPETAAATTPDLTRIPAGEWIITDVPVRNTLAPAPSVPPRPPMSR